MQPAIKTQRKKDKLLNDGKLYVYHFLSESGEVKYWRCEYFNTVGVKCKGRLHTDVNDNILKTVGVHICNISPARIEAQRIVTGIKRRAVDTMEGPSTIRAQVLQNVPTPVLSTVPSKHATLKIIKRARNEIHAPPSAPVELRQLQIPHEYQMYSRSTEAEEQFLLADSGVYNEEGRMGDQRILIFGRAVTATWADQIHQIYCDGTFALTPPLFSQIYMILARRGEWTFPVCYCLLTSKSKAAYTRMFELLQQCWPTFAPQSASIDFEQAMVGALRTKHPQCKINFCLFHLVRNMKKRISEQGLMQLYTNDVAFSLSARMITSLAFIPLQDLTPALAALENYLPNQLQPVLDWFVDNYVGQLRNNGTRRQPLFAPEEWSVHLRTIEGADRTNNFCEAFHRRLQRSFACTNPSIWHFIDTIRKEQKIVDADYARFIAGHNPAPKKPKYRDADARILHLVQLYVPFNNGNGNGDHQYAMQNQNPQRIIDFLTGISKNYHMKN